jgi:hypothetical protein
MSIAPGGGAGYDAYGMGGAMSGLAASYRTMPEAYRKIVDKLCEDKARSLRIYASPADVEGYSFWSDWKFEAWKTSVRQCWYWQMGYWILQDVADTVAALDESGTSVLDSPVKRIMSISFTQSGPTRMIGRRRGRGMQRSTSGPQTPQYVINIRTAMAAPPCTGRFCTADTDVMHFEIRAVVSANQVMHFIQELCSAKTHKFCGWYGDLPEQTFEHNQITVLEHTISPIDREDYEHASYRYGPGAVVELDLICEYLFVKGERDGKPIGYQEVEPNEVKNDILGIKDEDATN